MQGDTPTLIVNRALQIIGDNQPPVTGTLPNFDASAAGVAAALLYTDCVQTVARSFGFDFSRNTVVLALSGNAAPPQWTYEYAYPPNGVEIRQLLPQAIDDPNDPRPVRWTVGNATIAGVPTKVIWSSLANARAVYTNQPPEGLWDALFTASVERLLASGLAIALAGRPATAQGLLESARDFEGVAESRNG